MPYLGNNGLSVNTEAKVTQLRFIFSIDKDIGGFDVSVYDISGMYIPYSLAYLQEILHYPILSELFRMNRADEVSKVSRLAIFHDDHVYILSADRTINSVQEFILILNDVLVLKHS
jgi:hypothetical protein